MIFNDRLDFFDQCIAGERAQFDLLLSKNVFNTFDKGYDLYRDYILKKNSITNVDCNVVEDELIVHLKSDNKTSDLVSENMPKKGITAIPTDNGVDLHIKLIGVVNL